MRLIKDMMGELSEEEFSLKCTNYKFFAERVLGLDIMPFHEKWIKLVQNNKRVAIEAPTGFGKTTILGVAFCLWISWIQQGKQMMIVSKTLPQSTKILGDIQDEIENNELLKELIPKDKPSSNWCSKTYMELSTRCKIFCRPYSENIKGVHVDYVLGDEVASYSDYDIWHRFVVTRANAKNGTVVAISTPDNIGDLMQELLNNPEYVALINKAIEKGQSIWPAKFSLKKLAQIKNEIGIGAFEREYMCNPKAEIENAAFPPHLVTDCFDFGSGFSLQPQKGYTIIACDFAIASGPRADFDAYIILSKVGANSTIVHGERHKGFPIAAKIMRLEELFNIYSGKMNMKEEGEEEKKTSDEGLVAETNIKFIIDPSSVGQAVFEKLREKGLPVEAAKFDAISRNAMIINLRQMIENKDLVIPRNKEDPQCMNFTDTLVKELISIMETRTRGNVITYQSKAPHDDTVMALAMGCKAVSQQREFIDMMAF